MPVNRGYLPESLYELQRAMEAITAARLESWFNFPAEIVLTSPNGEPYGTLVWEARRHSRPSYCFYPDATRTTA